MGEKISRREFLKKWSIIGIGTIFAASKLGNMPAVHAQVSDNAEVKDISNDVIRCTSTGVFESGQSAEDLADAVNELNSSFSKALTDLKNTDIAKFVGAKGDTFTAVIEKLKSVLQKKTCTPTGEKQTIKPDAGQVLSEVTVEAVTITSGIGKTCYENGYAAGVIAADGRANVNSVNYKSGYSAGQTALKDAGYVLPSGKKSITANGTYDVKSYASVEVNILAGSLGTFSTTDTVTKTVVGASSKKFYCSVSDLSFTDLGVDVCDYADCAVSVNAPKISVNGNNVTITPAIVYVRFTGGTVFGLPGGVGARDSNRPYLTRAIPTTVYYQ